MEERVILRKVVFVVFVAAAVVVLNNKTLFWLLLSSLSSLVKPSENGNGVTFRSGADLNMDIGVSGFGPETAIDRSMAMVSMVSK